MEELTEEKLRKMYEIDLLSEAEIAKRIGTYQVHIGRLRRKFGIPSISKGDRRSRSLPSLTSLQQELIIGSLLGDGWIDATSEQVGRFNETHCDKQKDYLQWKSSILEPFSRPLIRIRKNTNNSVYSGWAFYTYSVCQFRPFYDLFYPLPFRKRKFPENLHETITPFILAVWYMDDGSLSKRGEPSITFGLDKLSLQRSLKAIRALGLHPKVYGPYERKSGKQDTTCSIHFPKQRIQFRKMIEPHVPPCMTYKLPFETKRQKGDRNARGLSSQKAGELYKGGLSVKEIASFYEVGESTVNRRIFASGVKKRRSGPGKQKLDQLGAKGILEKYDSKKWISLPEGEQDRWVEEVYKVLRITEFPYPLKMSTENTRLDFDKLRKVKMMERNGEIHPNRRIGIALCNSFFRSRFHAVSGFEKSAYEAWHREKDLLRAIRFQFKVGDPVIPHRVVKAVTMNCRTPSIFRPSVAKFIYDKFLPFGGKTWDPCSGYGGRFLGALASGVTYIGTDVDEQVVRDNNRLRDSLGFTTGEVELCPAEEFIPPEIGLVFTSPPYFHKEKYLGKKQSWKCYSTFEAWKKSFLGEIIKAGANALAPGGHWIMNIADVKLGRKKFPLIEAAKDEMKKAGLVEKEILKMPLSKLNRKDPWEPILVYQKR